METLVKNKIKQSGTGASNLSLFYSLVFDEVINKKYSHEIYITKSFEQFFGRVVLRLSIEMPELELIRRKESKFYGEKEAKQLELFIRLCKIHLLNDIHIDYEVKSKHEFEIDPYKHGYADSISDSIVERIEFSYNYENANKLVLHYEDNTI